jgi:hypothetical protein
MLKTPIAALTEGRKALSSTLDRQSRAEREPRLLRGDIKWLKRSTGLMS